MFTLINTKT